MSRTKYLLVRIHGLSLTPFKSRKSCLVSKMLDTGATRSSQNVRSDLELKTDPVALVEKSVRTNCITLINRVSSFDKPWLAASNFHRKDGISLHGCFRASHKNLNSL